MPQVRFDRFYRYGELTDLLKAYVAEYPQLLSIESIGKSYEGRDLWVMTIQNPATGAELSKPAIWVDGNVHGNEVQGGEACVYLAR